MLIRGGVPAVGGFGAGTIETLRVGGSELLAAGIHGAPAIGREQAFAGFDEVRQGGFGVGRDGDIGFGVALEGLVIALDVQVVGGDADDFHTGFGEDLDGAVQLVAHGVDGAPEVGDFETDDEIGRGDHGPSACLIQRVVRGELAADYGRLHCLGQFDEEFHAVGGAYGTVGEDDGVFGVDQELRHFGYGGHIAGGR